MTPIADMIEAMTAAGATPELILIAVRGAEINAEFHRNSTGIPPETAHERRKEWDRNRKRRPKLVVDHSTGIPPDSTGMHEQKEMSPTPPIRKTTSSELSNESSSSVAATPKKATKRKRSNETPWPEGWTYGPAETQMALEAGLMSQQGADEFERLHQHAIAHDRRLANWPAGLRMWFRSPFTKRNSESTGPPALTEAAREILRKTAERNAENERRKLNGQDTGQAADGSGTQSANHESELFPAR